MDYLWIVAGGLLLFLIAVHLRSCTGQYHSHCQGKEEQSNGIGFIDLVSDHACASHISLASLKSIP